VTDLDRLRLLFFDPMPFVHWAGLAAFAAFLVIFVAAMCLSFVVSLVWCGACRARDDVHLILPTDEREGRR
jgi:hypothetical protein